MKKVYMRCNGKDYFDVAEWNGYCPLDGWSSAASVELAGVVKAIMAAGDPQALSVQEFRRAGVSEDALARTIVIDFGANEFSFQAMRPQALLINGTWVELSELGPRWL